MRIAGFGSIVVLAGALAASSGVAAAQTAIAPQQTVEQAQVAGTSQGAQAEATPEFEVATIKPSDPAACCARTWSRNGRRFATTNTYLQWLIQWAYGLQAKQIVGGPAWMEQDRFDIAGEIEGTKIPTDPEWRIAVQKLLADRFQLQFHHESRVMSAYALSVTRGGPKLTKSDPEKDREPMLAFNGGVGTTMNGYGRDVTIGAYFADVQRLVLDRPVIDRTSITGTYNILLTFTREDPEALGMMQLPDNAAPNLITALSEQLGLKLEGVKAPVDVLVIDHVEKPSDN